MKWKEQDINDDFRLKNPFVSIVSTKIVQHYKGRIILCDFSLYVYNVCDEEDNSSHLFISSIF